MTGFTKSDFRRIAVSAIGALTVSAVCVLGAVGPAYANAPAPAAHVQAQQVAGR